MNVNMNSKLQNKWNYNLRSSDKHDEVYIKGC